MRLSMCRPKRTMGHWNTAELALEPNREKNKGGSDGEKKHEREGGKYLISSRGCSVHINSKKKHEKKVGRSRKEERRGWMEGEMDGQRGRIWRARKLIIQLVCWDAKERKWCELLKNKNPSILSPSTASCCALMSALFRQHVCCRHVPETNPLFAPPPRFPPSIHSSLYTLHLCSAYQQAPGLLKGTTGK